MNSRLHGLYVITDTKLCASRGLAKCVEAALRGGTRLVQYRDKSNDHERRLEEAGRLVELCETFDARLIVNDDIELAKKARAHGVHLGRDDDLNPERAHRLLGSDAIVGISCYNDFELAKAAMRTGASYVAFGSVFPSPTKPNAVRAPLDLFVRARNELALPTCAIGGIVKDNIGKVAVAGASIAAVVSAVFAADDIEAATRDLNRAFTRCQSAP